MAALVLIRHAPTAETGIRLTGRAGGIALSPTGRVAAEDVGAALAGLDVSAVHTSPVLRCVETARIVAAPHGLQPVKYRNLTETDYGSWTGRTLRSLRRTLLWRHLLKAPSRATFPGGESMAGMQQRVVAALEGIAKGLTDSETALVVSHGDPIGVALAHFLGMPLDLYHRIGIDPASWSQLFLPAEGAATVGYVNRVVT